MISIPRHFADKNPNRESQPISTAVSAAVATAGEARPTLENGKVTPPRRVANRERRTREHLTPQEVGKLMSAAGIARAGCEEVVVPGGGRGLPEALPRLGGGAQREGPGAQQEGPALDGGETALHHPHQEFGVAGLDQEGGGEIAPPPDQPRIVIDQFRQR
jgi:hypothetical protein